MTTGTPHVSIASLVSALDSPGRLVSSSSGLRLPTVVDKYRDIECTFRAEIRAIVEVTQRLLFLTLRQPSGGEDDPGTTTSSSAAASSRPCIQCVLKLTDATGWSAAQQLAWKNSVSVGQVVLIHAFLEITPTTLLAPPSSSSSTSSLPTHSSSSSSSSAAVVPMLTWSQQKEKHMSAEEIQQQQQQAQQQSLSPVEPVQAPDRRLSMHVISIASAASATNLASEVTDHKLHEMLVRHSMEFQSAVAAVNASQQQQVDGVDSSAPPQCSTSSSSSPHPIGNSDGITFWPEIRVAVSEEVARLELVRYKAAEAARIAALPKPALTEREKVKLANRERQRGEAKKRAPRCNVNRGVAMYKFLESTFGIDLLSRDGGVLDVAGGQGQLSFQLSKRDLPCCVVDPRPLGGGTWEDRRAAYMALRQRLADAGARPMPVVQHAQRLFNESFTHEADSKELWARASLVVGLHPDEATEDIVQLSLRDNKPFALVPCCVFPSLYPKRCLADGMPVRNHGQLCKYYQQLHEEIQVATLEFEGRNTVLFRIPGQKAAAVTSEVKGAAVSQEQMMNDVHNSPVLPAISTP